jgi:subtilisin family serine protease
MVSLPVVALLALAGTATAADTNNPITLSVESIRETVRAFQARPALVPRDGEPEVSNAAGSPSIAEAMNVKPPRGASSHQPGAEASVVETTVESRSVIGGKGTPERRADTGPAQTVPPPLETQQQISFSSTSRMPERGVGERLQRAAEASQGEGETYAFLLLNERLTPEIERDLEIAGVTILGPHDNALKVRVPLSQDALEAVAGRSYVHSLSYSQPEQKLSAELDQSVANFAGEVNLFPVIINLFEDDPHGTFMDRIMGLGVQVSQYDPVLKAYTALTSAENLRALADLDFVLFIELERTSRPGHDQSMATNGIDYIRAAGFTGAPITLGILDTGFMLGTAAATMHRDLNKSGCGLNFTSDAAGVWNDQHGHGTHVLATITGTGTAAARYRGVATGLGTRNSIRAAKIWTSAGTGQNAWLRDAMDYMDDATSCNAPRPQVLNLSGGATGTGLTGTDSESRKLDSKVWEFRQAYVVCGGNTSGTGTIWSPGVAKNALTVGNSEDAGALTVGELASNSSRGPTGDGRMKPNLVATGRVVTSARAGTTDQYTDMSGCSMATPHVTGIAASLMEHYPEFRDRPQLLRAHLMASAIPHEDQTVPPNNTDGGRNDYGLGRVSDYEAHWARPNPNGWQTRWAWQTITDKKWGYFDVDVPSNTDRIVAVMTWDEPEASAGASRAVTYDLDLWADFKADCVPDAVGQCGEWASQSKVDNTEYLFIDRPPAGKYRFKMVNWNAPSFGVPAAITIKIIEGDPTPLMTLNTSSSTSFPPVGSTFTVTTTVGTPAYEAYGVHVSVPILSPGLATLGVKTTREDGVTMDFPNVSGITLGNTVQDDTRSAIWRFRVDTTGAKTITFRAWSDNGGEQDRNVTVNQSLTRLP